jgi:deazaflavin-dependent oxidoreductase (nitroreductase family)
MLHRKEKYRMSKTTYRPHQTMLERVMGSIMGLPKFVMLLPFQTPMSRRLILLSYTGRKSGKPYTIPVSFVKQDESLLIPGGGAWKKNLENGLAVRVRLYGKDRMAKPEVIKDPDEVEQLVHFMMTANPAVSRFIGVPKQPDGHPNRQELEKALAGGFAVVRLHLVPQAAV